MVVPVRGLKTLPAPSRFRSPSRIAVLPVFSVRFAFTTLPAPTVIAAAGDQSTVCDGFTARYVENEVSHTGPAAESAKFWPSNTAPGRTRNDATVSVAPRRT